MPIGRLPLPGMAVRLGWTRWSGQPAFASSRIFPCERQLLCVRRRARCSCRISISRIPPSFQQCWRAFAQHGATCSRTTSCCWRLPRAPGNRSRSLMQHIWCTRERCHPDRSPWEAAAVRKFPTETRGLRNVRRTWSLSDYGHDRLLNRPDTGSHLDANRTSLVGNVTGPTSGSSGPEKMKQNFRRSFCLIFSGPLLPSDSVATEGVRRAIPLRPHCLCGGEPRRRGERERDARGRLRVRHFLGAPLPPAVAWDGFQWCR